MQKSLAVYTKKAVTTGLRVQELASAAGWSLRYLKLGGRIPHPSSPPDWYVGRLAEPMLVVGADSLQTALLKAFDTLYKRNDTREISRMLNQEELRWVELYADRFQFEKFVTQFPQSRADLESAVPAELMDQLHAAKTRYIVHNFSGSKENGQLMRVMADLLVQETDGFQITHKKPKR